MQGKSELPPYTPPLTKDCLPSTGQLSGVRGRRNIRRSRALKFFALACLSLIVLAQWKQVWRTDRRAARLSLEKLTDDLSVCKKLRHKPHDPIGLGRSQNARYIQGSRPTLIQNATIWVGEPVEGTSDADARAGKGWEWTQGDVYLEHGLIRRVERAISPSSLPQNTVLFNAEGRPLTSGIIDMHSHTGVGPLPELRANGDINEFADNITPFVRSIDGLNVLDHHIQVIKSGGVTTSLILPGSSNNIAGEAYLIKHAVGKKDGRQEISVNDTLADPERHWRYMKMACGENPKLGFGAKHRFTSRLGESFAFRHAFEQARSLIQKQDDWCSKADAIGVDNMDDYLPQELRWESLAAALRGQVHVNVHCYTAADLEAMVDHTNEFKFSVRTFHHAHQTFLVPEVRENVAS
ncbi:hypothetical protein E4U53_003075 [Claviceps sorghi]|nr:hypothetical protein E4U53_003075 [Claviceps sorghi]